MRTMTALTAFALEKGEEFELAAAMIPGCDS